MAGITWRAIAQTEPASSRATATMTLFLGRWRTNEKQGTAVLGRSWGNGVWFEREIPIGPTN